MKNKEKCTNCGKLKPKKEIEVYGCCEECAEREQLLADDDRYLAGK